jgi:hypothetical protein
MKLRAAATTNHKSSFYCLRSRRAEEKLKEVQYVSDLPAGRQGLQKLTYDNNGFAINNYKFLPAKALPQLQMNFL